MRNNQLFITGAALCCPEQTLVADFKVPCLALDKTLLPTAIRRRTSLTTQIAITAGAAACQQAGVDVSHLPSVFASVGGEIQVTDALCRLLPITDALLSPTQFHNSVHNTTSGYWSILNQCQAPSTAIAAVDDTFAMGLLEAWTQLQLTADTVLLVCYDEHWPQYLAPPVGQSACACALVLSTRAQAALGAITVPVTAPLTQALDVRWSDLVAGVPAAAALLLLQAIHTRHSAATIPLNNRNPLWFTHYEAF